MKKKFLIKQNKLIDFNNPIPVIGKWKSCTLFIVFVYSTKCLKKNWFDSIKFIRYFTIYCS